jgi:hypothetical protein
MSARTKEANIGMRCANFGDINTGGTGKLSLYCELREANPLDGTNQAEKSEQN